MSVNPVDKHRSALLRWRGTLSRSLRGTWFPRAVSSTMFQSGVVLTVLSSAALGQEELWIRQFGSTANEYVVGAAYGPLGGLFAGGLTLGSIIPNAPENCWLASYDELGRRRWIFQFAKPADSSLRGIASDEVGGIHCTGDTVTDYGGANLGSADVWVQHFDELGSSTFLTHFGTDKGDTTTCAAGDGQGGVYACGLTDGNLGGFGSGRVFVARFDSSGNQTWTLQFGGLTSSPPIAATPDGASGVFLVGETNDRLGGIYYGGTKDCWVGRVDSGGNLLWIRQVGSTDFDQAESICGDGAGGLYACGRTYGDIAAPNVGLEDAWVARLDGTGNVLWTRQIGTTSDESAVGVVWDGTDGVYVTGGTGGTLGGVPHGGGDPWIARYDGVGNMTWIAQPGIDLSEDPQAATSDGNGGLYILGNVNGSYGGPYHGGQDIWISRFGAACSAPITHYCTAKVSSSGCTSVLSTSGEPRVSYGPGFTLRADFLETSANAFLIFGLSGPASLPFHGGTLCVASPRYVLPPSPSQGTVPCTGTLTRSLSDLIAHPQGGPLIQAGAAVDCQVWFRDLNDPSGVGLSAGVEFVPCP